MEMEELFLKKIIISFLMFLIIFVTFNSNTKVQAMSYQKGDIFITSSVGSSGKGIVGHTGIVVGKNLILHTSGWKNEPYPKLIKIKVSKNSKETSWFKRYPKTKVARPNSKHLGKLAAKNAMKYFKGKKIHYRISPNPKDITRTYCSELVWYAYYKSGKTYKIQSYFQNPKFVTPSIIKPYEFSNKKYLKYNSFKLVDKKW